MKDISKEPWAEFAEQFAEEMLNHKVTEAVVMARSESEDRIVTNYYNAILKEQSPGDHLLRGFVLSLD